MNIRKILAILLVLTLITGLVTVTVACNDDDVTPEQPQDYKFNYEGITQPFRSFFLSVLDSESTTEALTKTKRD